MKIILDVEDTVDLTSALNACLMVMQQAPTQKVGETLKTSQGGQRYAITRNADSFRVEYG